MLQKSQCILLWAFSKDPELADRDYLTSLCKAMLNYEGARFELDNFDLLLVVQAISHIERSEFGEDPIFMNDFYQLATTAETFVVKNFDRLNIHEFTTIILFYLRGGQAGEHDTALSKALLDKTLEKVEDAVTEFNELQLTLLLRSIISFAVRNKDKYERSKFEDAVNKLD